MQFYPQSKITNLVHTTGKNPINNSSLKQNWPPVFVISSDQWVTGEAKLLPLVQNILPYSPCSGLSSYLSSPHLVSPHNGRADHVSCSWAVCGGSAGDCCRFGELDHLPWDSPLTCSLQPPPQEGPDGARCIPAGGHVQPDSNRGAWRCSQISQLGCTTLTHWNVMFMTADTAWAIPHLMVCLVVCLSHCIICSCMLLCNLMPTLIAWCYIIVPFWLLPSCL